jgi:heme oxygenase
MTLIERLSVETDELHARADEEVIQLLGPVTPADYRRFLVRMHGVVQPLERSISAVVELERVLDVRRFRKADLLRTDLLAMRFTTDVLDLLPHCTVPPFDSVEQALGWAYPIERSTLGHMNLYRHLATKLPGEVAFSAAYLKCYFGVVGESWRSYGDAIERVATSEASAQRVIDGARSSFQAWRAWLVQQDEQAASAVEGTREPRQL